MANEPGGGRLIRRLLPFERNYTTIPNAWVRDANISPKGLGILTILLSHKDGWTITLQALAQDRGVGIDYMRTGRDELEAAGYLIRRSTRRGLADDWELADPSGMSDPALIGYAGLRPKPVDNRSRIGKSNAENPTRHALENPTSLRKPVKNNSLPSATTVSRPSPVDNSDASGDSHQPASAIPAEPNGSLIGVAADNDAAALARIMHQPCPMRRDGQEHAFTPTGCTYCGIRTTQRWHNGEVVALEDLEQLTVPSKPVEAVEPADHCPQRSRAPHSYSKDGRCIDCGAPSPELVLSTMTGEAP